MRFSGTSDQFSPPNTVGFSGSPLADNGSVFVGEGFVESSAERLNAYRALRHAESRNSDELRAQLKASCDYMEIAGRPSNDLFPFQRRDSFLAITGFA